jgi:hypothetical protein
MLFEFVLRGHAADEFKRWVYLYIISSYNIVNIAGIIIFTPQQR